VISTSVCYICPARDIPISLVHSDTSGGYRSSHANVALHPRVQLSITSERIGWCDRTFMVRFLHAEESE
jgi:hypothetical protein